MERCTRAQICTSRLAPTWQQKIVQHSLEELVTVVKDETAPHVDGPHARGKPKKKGENDDDSDDLRVANPKCKPIMFCPLHGRYEVYYKAKDGKMKRSLKGLRVNQYDRNLKKPIEPNVLQRNMDMALKKARKRWNKLDTSDKKRIVIQYVI